MIVFGNLLDDPPFTLSPWKGEKTKGLIP